MDTLRYCAYNQNSESFLSLSVSIAAGALARLKNTFSASSFRADEGAWLTTPRGWSTISVSARRDLIYLDQEHKVVDVVESLPRLQLAPERQQAASILALPVRSIYASQTQPGNQLLICAVDDMEFRLRSIPQAEALDKLIEQVDQIPAGRSWAPLGLPRDRRTAFRKRWPRLIAYDTAGAEMSVHGIRDISATGLYLMTRERWPLGAQVKMTLQRTDGLDDNSMNPITVQLRVSRWGVDGVGLEFLQADREHTAIVATHVR